MKNSFDETTAAAATGREIEEAVFETALGLESPSARETFLKNWFRDDPAGFSRMSALLLASFESTSFFIDARQGRIAFTREISEELEPAPPEDFPTEGPGSWIGRYRIVERIGEGGGGVVYEAEQLEPVQRKVALKIIRLGMDTEAVITRFGIESQTLALMDHPHIARVLDAGATATGRPYFVMELVRGLRITSWCDEGKLDIRARLELFLRICDAIQHAHQKGIIHRDIKPSNILIQSSGGTAVPKVIDFGIAKATAARPPGCTLLTERDQMVGTPAYMSPEQIDLRGIDVDTRSDIYSLGALLYELVGGFPPFDSAALERAGMSEMRRILLEDDPLPPSRRVAAASAAQRSEIAAARRATPDRLVSLLRGDLDAIVSMAMEKDRARRYQTIGGLAMDVRRFLTHSPVIARRPGRLYLLNKFIRRNRAACASGVAVAVSLLGGLGTSTWLYLRERHAYAVQEILRWEAESARTQEARLHGLTQARANISQVAILLCEGKIEEADALLRKYPLASIEPSIEATGVFRSLGHWNAVYERWDQSLQCLLLLNQANRFDSPVKIVEGDDLLSIAPVLLEYGGGDLYEAWREDAVERYLPVTTTFSAEHMLKACLLKPAGGPIIHALRETAEFCTSGHLHPRPGDHSLPHWNTFSLTLFHFRAGDFDQAWSWSESCLSHPDPEGPREASTLALRAMIRHHRGDRGNALRDLEQARPLIPRSLDDKGQPSSHQRWWWDGLIARILLSEAETVIAAHLK